MIEEHLARAVGCTVAPDAAADVKRVAAVVEQRLPRPFVARYAKAIEGHRDDQLDLVAEARVAAANAQLFEARGEGRGQGNPELLLLHCSRILTRQCCLLALVCKAASAFAAGDLARADTLMRMVSTGLAPGMRSSAGVFNETEFENSRRDVLATLDQAQR